jgi:signal transduction histidine kinase
VRDLAAQAGLVMRNVALTEELREHIRQLRASRQRLVAAQDEERRKLERNLHDGAQQQMVALSVKLRLLEQLIDRDGEKAKSIATALQTDLGRALEELRDLARGIYPPLLADKGLVAALEPQARRSVVPVDVEGDGIGRYPREIEAAVYFSCLEALQNIAKTRRHPGSRSGSLTATTGSDSMCPTMASVSKPTKRPTAPGCKASPTGSRRSEMHVRSEPGAGTSVTGELPIAKAPD